MEIKNSLSMLKKINLIVLIFSSFVACSNLKTRSNISHNQVSNQPKQTQTQLQSNAQVTEMPQPNPILPPNQNELTAAQPVVPQAQMPKIGLILGPGGALTYAHIGFLQELQKQKIPVQSVAGVEFASTMAALYSMKGYANEVEWQMFKLKEDEVIKKSLIGGDVKTNDVRAISDFLKTIFGHAKAEDGRLPFACPALNLVKNQTFIMNRGSFEQLLPYCIAYPPLFKTYNNNVSGVRDIKPMIDMLRQQGANYIILVNVLGPASANRGYAGDVDSANSIYWEEISAFYSRSAVGIDHIVTLNIEPYNLLSFDKRREIMQKGQEQSSKSVEQLARKLGL